MKQNPDRVKPLFDYNWTLKHEITFIRQLGQHRRLRGPGVDRMKALQGYLRGLEVYSNVRQWTEEEIKTLKTVVKSEIARETQIRYMHPPQQRRYIANSLQK